MSDTQFSQWRAYAKNMLASLGTDDQPVEVVSGMASCLHFYRHENPSAELEIPSQAYKGAGRCWAAVSGDKIVGIMMMGGPHGQVERELFEASL